jgi:RecB family exonuclease
MDEDEFVAARDALVVRAGRHVFTSATALGHRMTGSDEDGDDKPERGDETEPWSRGRAGTHRGRAVHAALQSLPWDADDASIEAVAHAQAVAEAVPQETGHIARLIRQALATEAAGRARAAKRALREVPFAFQQGGITVEGFIDLVIESEDGSLEVVDWKTDTVPVEAVVRRLQSYELQAGLYVLGVEAATQRPVSRLTYVFVDPNEERSPGEARWLAAKARERLGNIVQNA